VVPDVDRRDLRFATTQNQRRTELTPMPFALCRCMQVTGAALPMTRAASAPD
jgi:hypothetical protein